MQRSNLPRETLRTIWALVDNPSKGYINRVQFTTIIRLVSIACSPIYMGSVPTMERYYETIRQNIPLPAGLYTPTAAELEAKAAAAAVPAVVAPTPVQPVPAPAAYGVPTAAHAPVLVAPAVAPVASHPTVHVSQDDDLEFSDFAAAPPSPAKGVHHQPPVITSSIVVEDNDDDFGDFGSATVAATAASVPASVPAPSMGATASLDPYSTGYGDAYGYGGYGVEESNTSTTAPAATLDLDDILGDFKAAPAPVAASSAPVVLTSSKSVTAFDDAFGSLDLSVDNTPAVEPVVATAPVEMKVETSHSLSSENINISAPLSTGSVSAPNSAQPMIMRSQSSHLSNNNLMVMSSAPDTSVNKMSAFDDLAENDLQAAAEDWDEFEEADPNAATAAAVAPQAAVAPPDPVELDLLDVSQHVEVTPLPSATGSAVPSTSFATFGDNNDFGDDFGGFESAEFTPAGTTPLPVSSTNTDPAAS